MPYVELHCHSAYSLLDGATHPAALVDRAMALGYSALALTDHDELGGAVAFAQAAHNADFAGIIGAELTVAVPHPASRVPHPASRVPRPTHLVLLAEDREGYGNLSTLITRARMDSPRGGRGSRSISWRAMRADCSRSPDACADGCRAWWRAATTTPRCDAVATLLDIFDRRVADRVLGSRAP